ncbi:hypothetical protein DYH09_18505 [bacterium CPR1]|nr:hypothetical protein [bacterium CPR1]
MQLKSFDFAPGTRLLYFLAVVTLVVVGGLLIVVGVATMMEPPISRGYRARQQHTQAGVVWAVMGVALIAGAAAPFRGWRRSGRSRVVLTEEELIFEEAGGERRVRWRDIGELSEVGTSLELVLRDRQGSLFIPRSYESFDELIEEIRTRARLRSDW